MSLNLTNISSEFFRVINVYFNCIILHQSVFVVRLTDRTSMTQGLVSGGSIHRAITQTRLAFPWKGAYQAPGNKHSLSKEGSSLRDGLLRLEDAGLGAPDMNDGFTESMSDSLDRLPPEQGHTRPDPCTDSTRPTEVCHCPAMLRGLCIFCFYFFSE